jgi:tetratricopeptide (TPR) repeat protein
MQSIKPRLQTQRILLLLLLLLSMPLNSYASELIYTIQTGSFMSVAEAKDQFDSLVQLVNEKKIDRLRIEKVGKFFTVRLGKYDKMQDAEKSLSLMKGELKSFLIMSAYYKEERIKKINALAKTEIATPQTIKEPFKRPILVDMQSPVTESVADKVDKKTDVTLREKDIQATSGLEEKKSDLDALEVLKAKLELRPEDPEMNGRYGTMLFRLKQPAEAIPYLRKAAELSPKVPEYNISIGYCYLLLSKFNEAVDEFNKAVNMSPSHVGALTGLGISYSELGEKDKAMGVYDKLKNLDSVLTNILLQIIEET